MSKQDYSEVIYQALTVLTEQGATDHKRFLALMRDLSVDYPSQMKFLQHNSDARYLKICSRALHAGDQELSMIRTEAVTYLKKEFSSSANSANSMSTCMIRAYAAYGREVRPAQVSIPKKKKDGSGKPEKPPTNPGGKPGQSTGGTSGKNLGGATTKTVTTTKTTKTTTTNTTKKTGSSSNAKGTVKKVIIFILISAICLGLYTVYEVNKYNNKDRVGDNAKSKAIQESKENFTHHLNELQFDVPVNCSEEHEFALNTGATSLIINADVPAIERTSPTMAALADEEEQENEGFEILDTGEVEIQDGPVADEDSYVTCRFIESEKDDDWEYKLFVPVIHKQCITVVEITSDDAYQGKKLRNKLLEDLEVNEHELSDSNKYEAGGLQFHRGDLRHKISYYDYRAKNGPITRVNVITPYSTQGAFIMREEDLNGVISYNKENNEDIPEFGTKKIDGHSGYWYEETYGELTRGYNLYLDRTDTWEESYQTYEIEVIVDYDCGHSEAEKAWDRFLDTIKFND